MEIIHLFSKILSRFGSRWPRHYFPVILFSVLPVILICWVLAACSSSKKILMDSPRVTDSLLTELLSGRPEWFDTILRMKTEWNVQIIYTQINRDQQNKPSFINHYFNLNSDQYFYPASTVKLPVSILALQKLNELGVNGLDMNTTMITFPAGEKLTGAYNDPTSRDGRPSVGHYIKKILLVSDNDAFNRLYEFLGQEYIHEQLGKRGYHDAQILHRLEIYLEEEQNRLTNAVKFMGQDGNLVYEKPELKSRMAYAGRSHFLGKGYLKDGQPVNEPFDFSKKNRLPLQELHDILKSVIFPKDVSVERRFNLTDADYAFLQKYMSMYLGETAYPAYDSLTRENTRVKFFLSHEMEKSKRNGIREFNKPGDAYGFLTDAAYIVDFENKVEFMLSATILCNTDGIFNDDHYDYDTIGFPFFTHLGNIVYEYELKRRKEFLPDLSAFRINYTVE